nr:retrotransposon protein, putative, Ty1-copia subclass [Tanacetum cinerariifolium]
MANHIPNHSRKCFAMKDLGESTFILEIKIYRDGSKRLIGLGQNAYMDKILERYKMDNSKRGHIPMQERLDLNKAQGASTPEKVYPASQAPHNPRPLSKTSLELFHVIIHTESYQPSWLEPC